MKQTSLLFSGLAAGAVLAAALLAAVSAPSQPALAQPAPVPQECVCSAGVDIGSARAPVLIRHCQCGILSCAVVVSSGELQCVR
jgi:hypothetical protein